MKQATTHGLKRLFCATLVLSVSSSLVCAQTLSTGQVLGRVTDRSEAVVPGASVELRDTATGAVRTATSNAAGQYTFVLVPPGAYSVSVKAEGFQQAVVPSVVVQVGKSYTVHVTLPLGPVSQTVEVTSTPGAELQTTNATVGNNLGGDALQLLPSQARNTTGLLLLQPLSMPQQAPGLSSRFGGQVAGARSDQNAFILDGSDITNTTSGNTDYYTGFAGGPEGAIPTPVESIQEFKVATNNRTGSFNSSSGGAVMLVSKRGANQFHGSLYEFHQNSALGANTWDLNRLGQPRPPRVDNRFGGSLGGPFLPDAWKSYFYFNYEGRRLPVNTVVRRLVPSDSLRQGLLRFRDASGRIVAYDLATSRQCGPGGSSVCDPRGTGLNSLVRDLWSRFEPDGNDLTRGDGLNTSGFQANEKYPVSDSFAVVRLDHSFGSNWQLMLSYRYFREIAGSAQQTDIGGLVAGHIKGTPAATSTLPRQPRYLVLGLTHNLTPNATNDFHFSYLRDWWEWGTVNPAPQVAGTSGALAIGGDSVDGLIPLNLNTGGARNRMWNGHNFNYQDNVSWLKGNHLLQLGGSLAHNRVFFQRNDGQLSTLSTLVYYLNRGQGINIPDAFRPPTCSSALTANCLPAGQINSWNNLYAEVLGMVDLASILRTRDAQLHANPLGTLLNNTVRYDRLGLYAQDTWRLHTSLTVTYGLAWGVSLPPAEETGKQILTADSAGNIIIPGSFLEQRKQAALSGQALNPQIGFVPIRFTSRKRPFDTVTDQFGPRLAAAWTPAFRGGWLGRLFGHEQTVIRGGYSRTYDRLNGVQQAIDTLQGVGFGLPLQCIGPSRTGQCLGIGGSDPNTALRIGIDGSAAPLPPFAPTVTPPLVPGVGGFPFAPSSFQQDPHFRPASNNEWALTVQRQMPGKAILEIGYVRRTASNLYQGVDLNQVPFFLVAGGQSFAQAFDTLAQQMRSGAATQPQPFFETALRGSSVCNPQRFSSCTAAVVSSFGGAIASQQVRNVFEGIQSSFVFGPATAAANQVGRLFFYSSTGVSSYNAGFLSYRQRTYKGLTLDANFTYGHSLDNSGLNQDIDAAMSNSYNRQYDYGSSVFDRKFAFNLLGVYELPFRSSHKLMDRLIRGWAVAPIFTAHSGLPLHVADGSGQEFGQTTLGRGADAVLTQKNTFGHSVHGGVSGDLTTQAGVNGNPARGGSGLNLFANPAQAYSAFRPILASQDTSATGGTLRGLGSWNLDLTVARKIPLTERISTTVRAQFFNLFNHVNFRDPSVNLQNPQSFGVIGAQANLPRAIELGLRIDF